MRFSLVTAACAISCALLAGCSGSSQGQSALLNLPSAGSAARGSLPPAHQQASRQAMPEMMLKALKLQLAGKLPSPFTKAALRHIYKEVSTQKRPSYHLPRQANGVAAWAVDTPFGYMVGMKGNVKKLVTAVDVESNGCYEPLTVKEDAGNNAWVNCEINSQNTAGAAQEYSSTGALENTYSNPSVTIPCQPSWTICQVSGYSFDEATNSQYVVVATTSASTFYCPVSFFYCYYDNNSGFSVWPAGNSTAVPTFVSLYEITDSAGNTIDNPGYLDMDSSNNVYFTYVGLSSAGCSGYGLDVVPVTGGTPTALINPCGIGFWGGVYSAQNGAQINVIDQDTRSNYQYAIPWTGTPSKTLGPTMTNPFGYGDPIQGTFNAGSTKMAIGDSYGWIDAGTVSTNKWAAKSTTACTGGCSGVTYQPSDRYGAQSKKSR